MLLTKLILFGILVARFTWCFYAENFNAKNLCVNGLTLMVAVIALITE